LEISLEKLIQLVTMELVKELKKQGVTVTAPPGSPLPNQPVIEGKTRSEEIDMSKYVTPVLTENQIRKLHPLTAEVIVPAGTVISPNARELLREKQLRITKK